MAKHPEFDGDGPKIGDNFTVEVVPSPTRTTYFPDQAAVFSRGEPYLEIVMLRQEVSLKSQTGTVTGEHGDNLVVQFMPKVVLPELVDIAHVRLEIAAAVDMAVSILNHAMVHGGAVREELLNRLQSEGVQST